VSRSVAVVLTVTRFALVGGCTVRRRVPGTREN
jgi:hypothetical protein